MGMTVTVEDATCEKARHLEELRVLPPSHWGGGRSAQELLAAFVRPNGRDAARAGTTEPRPQGGVTRKSCSPNANGSLESLTSRNGNGLKRTLEQTPRNAPKGR